MAYPNRTVVDVRTAVVPVGVLAAQYHKWHVILPIMTIMQQSAAVRLD
jgi:hypothetical protein